MSSGDVFNTWNRVGCFERLKVDVVDVRWYILYYILYYYYTIIIHYILYIISYIILFLILICSSSSKYSSFYSSDLSSVLLFLSSPPILLPSSSHPLFLSPHLPLSSSFKVYVSAFGYPYLYILLIYLQFLPPILILLSFPPKTIRPRTN